jgi:hypothetical protein
VVSSIRPSSSRFLQLSDRASAQAEHILTCIYIYTYLAFAQEIRELGPHRGLPLVDTLDRAHLCGTYTMTSAGVK